MIITQASSNSSDSSEPAEPSEPSQPNAVRSISVALTGSGGSGVMTAGQMLLDSAARAGLHGIMTRSLGPQIRGGEAAAFLRLSSSDVSSGGDRVDLLFAFDWLSTERFAAEIALGPESLVLSAGDAGSPPEWITESGACCETLPIKEMLSEIPGGRPNMVALGVLARLVGLEQGSLQPVIERALRRKGPEALAASAAAVGAGFDASDAFGAAHRLDANGKTTGRWNISGNEAIGLGALRGGVRFVAAYPITPATEILEWLAPNLEHLGGELVQAEDELASINMIIGGSFGGVPSLTATSGPGLALMIEALGLSLASETPIVVIDVQRGGPSTGIPTKSEQTDLNIALYGLHGDAPHIVTATNSVADCVQTTQWSVHLAETLQCPVIVLTDQLLGQMRAIVDRPPELKLAGGREIAPAGVSNYQRYAVTKSGISPMAIPGTAGGEYVADGLEHTPAGRPSSQAEDHLAQLDKRQRKLDGHDYGDLWADVEGEGDIAIITWGSCTGPAREVRARALAQGLDPRLISLRLLSPPQTERFRKAIEGVRRAVVVEQSHSRQFYHYLRAFYDLPPEVQVFNRPGPLPIRPGQVFEALANGS